MTLFSINYFKDEHYNETVTGKIERIKKEAKRDAAITARAAQVGVGPNEPTPEDGRTAEKTADAVGVSAATVKRVRRVQDNAPDLWERVEAVRDGARSRQWSRIGDGLQASQRTTPYNRF